MRLQWFVIGITLIVSLSTYDQPELFNMLVLGLVLVTALVSLKWDRNLLTLCIIYSAGYTVEQVVWLLSRENLYFLLPAYLYLAYACYLTRYSRTGKISILFGTCAAIAELYWFAIDKEGPRVFWYVFLCATLLIVKHSVLLRPHFCSIRFPKYDKDWAITKTDIDIGYVLALRIILEFLNLAEYLVRHIIGYPSMLIYNSYTYFVVVIFAFTFYLFFRSFAETIKNKLFPA